MSDDLVSVLWTSSLVEAEIAKGRLEAESIPVQLRGEGADAPSADCYMTTIRRRCPTYRRATIPRSARERTTEGG